MKFNLVIGTVLAFATVDVCFHTLSMELALVYVAVIAAEVILKVCGKPAEVKIPADPAEPLRVHMLGAVDESLQDLKVQLTELRATQVVGQQALEFIVNYISRYQTPPKA